MPNWQKLLIAVDCAVGIILLAAAAWAFVSYMKKNVLIYKDLEQPLDKPNGTQQKER